MGTILTSKKLAAIYQISQANADKWFPHIDAALDKFSINSRLRISAFLAQIGHESAKLTAVSENLNYSASGLTTTFGKYFDAPTATDYARQPERIANRVYANRLGNGNEASGDGWRYRGRGLVQVTGKENYGACSKGIGKNGVENPDLLTEPADAALSAGWFWNSKGLNNYADRSEFDTITRRVNGGLNGKADRDMLYQRALKILDDKDAETTPDVVPEPAVTSSIEKQETPTAVRQTVAEPAYTGTKSGYPENVVYESPSGHVVEFDDTPGNERIHVYHRTGSYYQIGPDGDVTIKSVRDHYQITTEDDYKQVGGNQTETVQGQSFKSVTGSVVIKSGASITLTSPERVQLNTPLVAFQSELVGPTATFQQTSAGILDFTSMSGASGTVGQLTVGSIRIGTGSGGGNFADTFDVQADKVAIKKPQENQEPVTMQEPLTLGAVQIQGFLDPSGGGSGLPILAYKDPVTNSWMNIVTGAVFVPAESGGGGGTGGA